MKLNSEPKSEKFPLPALLILPLLAVLLAFAGCATQDDSGVMAAPDGSDTNALRLCL